MICDHLSTYCLCAVEDIFRRRMEDQEMMERLAAIEHERWAGWMQHQFALGREYRNQDDEPYFVIESRDYLRWKRQASTPYASLSEREKESDRCEVRKTLAALKSVGVQAEEGNK